MFAFAVSTTSVPVRDVQGLIALARARPGQPRSARSASAARHISYRRGFRHDGGCEDVARSVIRAHPRPSSASWRVRSTSRVHRPSDRRAAAGRIKGSSAARSEHAAVGIDAVRCRRFDVADNEIAQRVKAGILSPRPTFRSLPTSSPGTRMRSIRAASSIRPTRSRTAAIRSQGELTREAGAQKGGPATDRRPEEFADPRERLRRTRSS